MKYPSGRDAKNLIVWAQNGATKEVLIENFNISQEQASYIKMKAPPLKKFDRRGDHDSKLKKPQYSMAMITFAKLLVWARNHYGCVSRNVLNDLVNVFLSLKMDHPGVSTLWQMYVSGWVPSEEQIAVAFAQRPVGCDLGRAPSDHFDNNAQDIPRITNQEMAIRLAAIRMRLGHIKSLAGVKDSEAERIYKDVNGASPPSGPLPNDIINHITRSNKQQILACNFLQLACMSGAINSRNTTLFVNTFEAYQMTGFDPDRKFEASHAYMLLQTVQSDQGRKILTPCSCGMPIFPSRGTTQSTSCIMCRTEPSRPKPKANLAKARAKLWGGMLS